MSTPAPEMKNKLQSNLLPTVNNLFETFSLGQIKNKEDIQESISTLQIALNEKKPDSDDCQQLFLTCLRLCDLLKNNGFLVSDASIQEEIARLICGYLEYSLFLHAKKNVAISSIVKDKYLKMIRKYNTQLPNDFSSIPKRYFMDCAEAAFGGHSADNFHTRYFIIKSEDLGDLKDCKYTYTSPGRDYKWYKKVFVAKFSKHALSINNIEKLEKNYSEMKFKEALDKWLNLARSLVKEKADWRIIYTLQTEFNNLLNSQAFSRPFTILLVVFLYSQILPEYSIQLIASRKNPDGTIGMSFSNKKEGKPSLQISTTGTGLDISFSPKQSLSNSNSTYALQLTLSNNPDLSKPISDKNAGSTSAPVSSKTAAGTTSNNHNESTFTITISSLSEKEFQVLSLLLKNISEGLLGKLQYLTQDYTKFKNDYKYSHAIVTNLIRIYKSNKDTQFTPVIRQMIQAIINNYKPALTIDLSFASQPSPKLVTSGPMPAPAVPMPAPASPMPAPASPTGSHSLLEQTEKKDVKLDTVTIKIDPIEKREEFTISLPSEKDVTDGQLTVWQDYNKLLVERQAVAKELANVEKSASATSNQAEINRLKDRLVMLEFEIEPLLENYREKEMRARAIRRFKADENLNDFYNQIQIRLQQIFTAFDVVASKMVDQTKGTLGKIAVGVSLLGKIVAIIPGGEAAKTIPDIIVFGLETLEKERQVNFAKFMSSLGTRKQLAKEFELTARILADRYEEQLKELPTLSDAAKTEQDIIENAGSIEKEFREAYLQVGKVIYTLTKDHKQSVAQHLADIAVLSMLVFLESKYLLTDRPLHKQLIESVTRKLSTLENIKETVLSALNLDKIATKHGKKWNLHKILVKPGIITEQGIRYDSNNTNSTVYGYRKGSFKEAYNLGMLRTHDLYISNQLGYNEKKVKDEHEKREITEKKRSWLIEESRFEANINAAALASQRAVTKVKLGTEEKNCLVVHAEPDGNCGFTSIKKALIVLNNKDIEVHFERKKFIHLIEKIFKTDNLYQVEIENLFKITGCATLDEWKAKFASSNHWLEDVHFRFISRYFNIRFHFYYIPPAIDRNMFEPESSYEEIYCGNDSNSAIIINLAHTKTHLISNTDIPLNHFDAIIVEPTEEQKKIIARLNSHNPANSYSSDSPILKPNIPSDDKGKSRSRSSKEEKPVAGSTSSPRLGELWAPNGTPAAAAGSSQSRLFADTQKKPASPTSPRSDGVPTLKPGSPAAAKNP